MFLVGLPLFSAGAPAVTAVFLQGVSNTVSSTSKTMTHNGGVRTGKWVVAIGSQQGSGPLPPTSVTFCGVALTNLIGVSGASRVSSSLWVSTTDITTDGTDDVVATFGSNQANTISYLYAVDNLLSTTAIATSSSTVDPGALSLNTLAGGLVIGVSATGTAAGTMTWSGLTEQDDTVVGGSYNFSTAFGLAAAAETPRAVSADYVTTSTNFASCAVSLR